jgi:hypothetical protein
MQRPLVFAAILLTAAFAAPAASALDLDGAVFSFALDGAPMLSLDGGAPRGLTGDIAGFAFNGQGHAVSRPDGLALVNADGGRTCPAGHWFLVNLARALVRSADGPGTCLEGTTGELDDGVAELRPPGRSALRVTPP